MSRALAGAGLMAVVVAPLAGCATQGSTSFDSRAWREARAGICDLVGERRWNMVDDVQSNTLQRGMRKLRLRAILGRPDESSPAEPGTRATWDYWLGFHSGFEMDCDLLTLSFDRSGRLDSWSVWQS
jgi:outer membrane protein assembly factor BamE (lipoprotein component of BamABCDE complex)